MSSHQVSLPSFELKSIEPSLKRQKRSLAPVGTKAAHGTAVNKRSNKFQSQKTAHIVDFLA